MWILSLKWQTKVEKKQKKLQIFDLSYFIGKSYFDDGGLQNSLVFQLLFKTFTTLAASDRILA